MVSVLQVRGLDRPVGRGKRRVCSHPLPPRFVEHNTTFYLLLILYVCFPNSDHVMFYRESAFFLFVNYAYIGTWMHARKTKFAS